MLRKSVRSQQLTARDSLLLSTLVRMTTYLSMTRNKLCELLDNPQHPLTLLIHIYSAQLRTTNNLSPHDTTFLRHSSKQSTQSSWYRHPPDAPLGITRPLSIKR